MGMYELAEKLYPIHRSLTGEGVRETLKIIQAEIPIGLNEIPSGSKVFDWEIPPEWNIYDAYVLDLSSNTRVIDIKDHNLHIVAYSSFINEELSYKELLPHLHYIKEQPTAIPFVTSYYEEQWGFCLTYEDFLNLNQSSNFKVFIDSNHNAKGSLTYAELIIPGRSQQEIFFSSYICHPQMCNNELSGPVILTELAKYISNKEQRKYTYRLVFVPETIGSIAYLSNNLNELKKNVFAGYNLTCLGDERTYSYIPSRLGNTISDKVAKKVLNDSTDSYIEYSWLDRGSDERQYCSPGVDLPVCSITRSKYQTYPEYHTSHDNFDLVTKKGLRDSFTLYSKIIDTFEKNFEVLKRNKENPLISRDPDETYPKINVLGEPQLGKRGLYQNMSKTGLPLNDLHKNLWNLISYCDGEHSITEISRLIGVEIEDSKVLLKILKDNKLLEE